MKNHLFSLSSGALLTLCFNLAGLAQTQGQPAAGAGVGLAKMTATQHTDGKDIAAKTTTTVTYRGQSFLLKRTPDDLLTGAATDRIAQLENQLSFCYSVLLADTLNPTCPPEREATIRAVMKYVGLNRPNWDQTAYRQEFKFYLAEDKRRRRAYDY